MILSSASCVTGNWQPVFGGAHVNISAPGLIACGLLIHLRRFSALLSRTPAAVVVRGPTCVRLGPVVPRATGLPFTVRQVMQPETRNCCSPAFMTSVAGAGRSDDTVFAHASKSACVCTNTR